MKKILILSLVGTFAFSYPATNKKSDCTMKMKSEKNCAMKMDMKNGMKMKSEKNCTMKMDMKNGMKCQAGKCSSGK